MLTEKVKNFILENSLILDNESVLVAFSGGADSMCLLHILKTLSYNVYAAHLNHGLRGVEAERDMQVAKDFCLKFDIPFFSLSSDVSAIAKRDGISEETAGRNERYRFFDSLAEKYGINKIATAHNKNDNVETVLMHILRGTGADGLSGIPKIRGNIVRPLLSCSRKEIEEYCKQHSLNFVTDSTNLETVYTRNKIRLDLIPQLETYNQNLLSSLTNLSEISLTDKDFFTKMVNEIVANNSALPIKDIINLHDSVMTRVVKKLCDNAGISAEYKHIKTVCSFIKSGASGKKIDLPGGFVELSCGQISAKKFNPEEFIFDFSPDSCIEVGHYIVRSNQDDKSGINFILPINADIKIRSRISGDKMKIRGMTKKISDIFIDKKIPSGKRNEIPLLEVNGEIFYIFGIEESDLSSKYSNNDKTFVLNISNKEYTNE